MITVEQCKPGLRVWYEASPGVRFLGTVEDPPRKLGQDHVTRVRMDGRAYGSWRGTPERTHVPAAALFSLHEDHKNGGSDHARASDQSPPPMGDIVGSATIGTARDRDMKSECVARTPEQTSAG